MLPEPLQTVTLTIYDKHANHKQSYSLKVIEIQDDQFIIQSPISNQPPVTPLRSGTEVELSYVHNSSYYVFQTEVIKKYLDREPLLVLRTPSPDQIRKVQRRQYLRVPTDIQSTFEVEDEEGEKQKIKVRLINLSGGGFLCAFSSTEMEKLNLQKDTTVEGNLLIEERGRKHYIPYKARVVNLMYDDDKKQYEVAFQFTEIKEADREVIIRYCFARQLELHRKGVKS